MGNGKSRELEEEHSFIYQGQIPRGAKASPQAPLSAETARVVALNAWYSKGRIRLTGHFRKRTGERKFTIFDVEHVIRYGKPSCPVEFCTKFANYRYRFEAEIDGLTLKIAFALDATQEYHISPLVILITGVWKNRTGKRIR